MKTNPRKILTFDRILLLCILLAQSFIIYRYVERRGEHGGAAAITADNVTHNDHHTGSDRVPMQLPLLPDQDSEDMFPSGIPRNNDIDEIFSDMHDEMDLMMQRAREEFERIYRFMDMDEQWDSLMRSPAMDIREHSGDYTVTLSLPDVDPSDVTVRIDDRLLTIEYTAQILNGNDRSWREIEKKVLLPGPVDAGNISKTVMDNGFLKITVKKKEQAYENKS